MVIYIMNNITASVTTTNISYSINTQIETIQSNLIIIIFNYKGNIIYSTSTLSSILYKILFYTNNNNYILLIQNKKLPIINNIVKSFFCYKDITVDALNVILYIKINNSYNILSKVSSDTNIEFNYKIPALLSNDINVLCILDEFSYNCFKYECNIHSVEFNNWEHQFKTIKPQLLLVESVWNAVSSGFTFSKKTNMNTLTDIHTYCLCNNIPTVFWNKEDDIKYDHFLKHALKFDIILTTDERCVPRYKNEYSTKTNIVDCLEFACQPQIHNPLNQNRTNDVLFAGRWYHDYPSRNLQIENLIGSPEFKNKYHLDIYDRYYVDIPSFPSKYNKMLKKKLAYSDINNVSKKYKIMLNVNTIADSNTMFSRRVYEGLATGCSIISTPSIGIEKKFKDNVFISTSIDDTSKLLKHILENPTIEYLSFMSHRRVIKTDNYSVRFKRILDIAYISYHKTCDTLISIISSYSDSNTVDTLRNFLNCISKQSYTNYIVTIFVKTEQLIIMLNKLFTQSNISFVLASSKQHIMKLMTNIYIAKLDINSTYDSEYIYDSLLPFLYINSSIKEIGGVNRYSYDYISEPSNYATFYRT